MSWPFPSTSYHSMPCSLGYCQCAKQYVLNLKKRNQRTDIHTLSPRSSETLCLSTPVLDIPTLRQNLIQMLNTFIRNTLLSVTSGCKQTNNQEQPHVSIRPQSHSTWLHKMVALPNLRVSSVTNFSPQLTTAVWTYAQQANTTPSFLVLQM